MRARIAQLAEQIDAHRKRQQATHSTLTLTGMYNVLEALRAAESGTPRAFTAKEKTIHEQGLVGVLKELHDELDAAVLEAYGWSDLIASVLPRTQADALLLDRLVALNAVRATEEKSGLVRWLRPEYQNPALSEKEQETKPDQSPEPVFIQETLGSDASGWALPPDVATAPATTAPAASTSSVVAWPDTLPHQVRAVAQRLAASGVPMRVADIEAAFKGRGKWKQGLSRILETLEVLGRARSEVGSDGQDPRWRAL